jgi:hypothetical protein
VCFSVITDGRLSDEEVYLLYVYCMFSVCLVYNIGGCVFSVCLMYDIYEEVCSVCNRVYYYSHHGRLSATRCVIYTRRFIR